MESSLFLQCHLTIQQQGTSTEVAIYGTDGWNIFVYRLWEQSSTEIRKHIFTFNNPPIESKRSYDFWPFLSEKTTHNWNLKYTMDFTTQASVEMSAKQSVPFENFF